MTIEICIPKTRICLRRKGVYTSLVTTPLTRDRAEALAPQYGFRPDEVVLVAPVEMRSRRIIDDRTLYEALAHYPENPNRTHQELLGIIRCHIEPRAVRIV